MQLCHLSIIGTTHSFHLTPKWRWGLILHHGACSVRYMDCIRRTTVPRKHHILLVMAKMIMQV